MQEQAETLMNDRLPDESLDDGESTGSPPVVPKRRLILFSGVLAPLTCICLCTTLAVMRGGLSGDWSRDIGYLLMSLSVPVVNWHLLESCKHDKDGLSPALMFCGGLTLIVSLLFSCLFLPPALMFLCWLASIPLWAYIAQLATVASAFQMLKAGAVLCTGLVVVGLIALAMGGIVAAIVWFLKNRKTSSSSGSPVMPLSLIMICGVCIWALGVTVLCFVAHPGYGFGWVFYTMVSLAGLVLDFTLPFAAYIAAVLIGVPAVAAPFMAFGAGCKLMMEGLRTPAANAAQLRALCLSLLLGLPVVFLYDSDRAICKQIILSLWCGNYSDERAMIRLVREFSLERDLLSLCYPQSGPALDLDTLLLRLPQVQIPTKFARQIYYRVTGQPFNTAPLPPLGLSTGIAKVDDPDWAADEVGGKSNGLRLSQSTIKGDICTDYGVAQLDWNITFANDASADKEARVQILLPPGAVVSGAKLWMNGVAHQATFCETNIARDIYSNVVRVQRRDPLLITTSGPNRIEVQCFPVAPHSEMHAALSVIAPVQFLTSSKGAIVMPRIIEKNFDDSATTHLELHVSNDARNRDLDESVSDAELAKLVVSLEPTLPAGQLQTVATGTGAVVQNVKQVYSQPLRDLEIVIDASASLGRHLPEVRQLLQSLPPGRTAHVYLASDEIGGTAGQSLNREEISQAVAELGTISFAGGPDNIPALAAACRYAHQHHGGVIWLHGPQPVIFDSSQQELSALLFSDLCDVSILDLPLVDGANRTLSAFDSTIAKSKPVVVSPSSLGVGRSLSSYIRAFCGVKGYSVVERRKVDGTAVGTPSPEFVSASLEKLMAYGQIRDLLSHGDAKKASGLGEQARLVTPVTAALVVEPNFTYVPDTSIHQPEQIMGPGLDGVLTWNANRIIQSAFHAVASQLNNLSSAAGASGTPGQSHESGFAGAVSPIQNFSASAAAGGGDVNSGSFTGAPKSVPGIISQPVAELSSTDERAVGKHSRSPMSDGALKVVSVVLSGLLSVLAGFVFLLIAEEKRWLRNHIIQARSLAAGVVVITLIGLHFATPAVRDLMICLFS